MDFERSCEEAAGRERKGMGKTWTVCSIACFPPSYAGGRSKHKLEDPATNLYNRPIANLMREEIHDQQDLWETAL
jgi:hypothetical protein